MQLGMQLGGKQDLFRASITSCGCLTLDKIGNESISLDAGLLPLRVLSRQKNVGQC